MSLALGLLAAALLSWPSPAARRAARLRSVAGTPGTPPAPASPARVRRFLLPAAAGVAVALLVGGPLGAVLGVLAAVVADRLAARARPAGAAEEAVGEEVPVTCDLLAVCLAAGLPVGGALAAVATALPGPTGDALAVVAGRMRLGAAPRAAWAGVPPGLAGLGRVLVRAGESGAAAVPALRVLAADARQAARSDAEAAVRRAGVWVLAPLGACFLPAFVCLGIAPMVIGIAGQVFG